MIKKQYLDGNDARAAIKRVAINIGDRLGKTLGPAGRDYQVPRGITNDGKTILSEIRFQDECEDNVALAFHEIANRTDEDAGDGTTTSIVLGAQLIQDLVDEVPDIDTLVPGQELVMALSRRLEEEKDIAIGHLKDKAVPVTTLEQLEQVAFTSMEDKEVAKLIAKTVFDAGKDSFTALEEGFSGKVETAVQAGIEMPLKLNYGSAAEAVNVPVLVANHLFEDYRELAPFMASLVKFVNDNQAPIQGLVIVGKKFSIPFIQSIAQVNSKSPLQVICLSNDHLDDTLFEDLAAFVDAKLIDTHPKTGTKITSVKFTECGLASKVSVTAKGAVFYGGKGTVLQEGKETTRVIVRTMALEEELKGESSDKNRKALERRISEFKGGKTTVYVDAKTVAEKFYLKLKVQDCINSCKAALEGGMVRGGGLSLKEVADAMPEDALIRNALMAPYNRIQLNAGGALLIGEDVFDAYLVVEAGVRNAVSVVKTVIRLEGLIADKDPDVAGELQKLMYGDA